MKYLLLSVSQCREFISTRALNNSNYSSAPHGSPRRPLAARRGIAPVRMRTIHFIGTSSGCAATPWRPQGSEEAKTFVHGFLKRSMPKMKDEDIQDMLTRKAVVLEHYPKKKAKQKRKKTKGFTARQRRELRLFEIEPEQQRYALFLPLHELWKQYIRDLCHGLRPDAQPHVIQGKLLKADLHGAIVTVTKSKCPSYVGITGIILQEFKHVFKIITKEDKLKVVPKLNNVFSLELDGFISYIYGSKFLLRASERSAKKFKLKGTIDL